MTTNAPVQQIDPNVLAQALVALAQQGASTATKAVSSIPRTSGYGHGPYGLMSAPGLSRDIVNAMLLPYTGLASRLPSYPTNEANPLYGIITGQTAGSGSQPTGICDDPPMAGLLKLCTQSAVFGRYSLATPVIDIDRVGLTTNRGETYDHRLIGNPFAVQGVENNAPSTPGGISLNDALSSEIAKAMFELSVDWIRRYGPMLYTGNPANNTSGGGYKEYRGLDGLINIGYRDAETGIACTAADSILSSFGSANVSVQATNIVPLITSMYRRLKLKARGMGLWPVKWVLVMRETLFYELTQLWACIYATYRCVNSNAGFSVSQPNITSNETVMKLRQDMRGDTINRTGQYLLIDDEQVEVIFDDFVTETALANGAFNSSIYFVPMTVIGGRVVTYMEFLNYDMPNGALAAARALAPGESFTTTDGGRYMWHRRPPTNFCVQALVKTEPRLILRTPQLAARLTNIAYTPLAHEADWNPTGYYFANGGSVSRGTAPSFWPPNTNIS
jgi:hypothetical protein